MKAETSGVQDQPPTGTPRLVSEVVLFNFVLPNPIPWSTTALLIAGVGTVPVAVTEPRVWDADRALQAPQLPIGAGWETAVEPALVPSRWAVSDVVARAGVAGGW